MGQERTAQHARHAQQHPAGAARQHRAPPAPAVGGRALGHEAQVIDLLADLHHQGEHDGARGAEGEPVELGVARDLAGQLPKLAVQLRLRDGKPQKRCQQQHGPDRLRPGLQARDEGDAPQHHGDDHQRRDHVAQHQWPAQRHLQRQCHDRGLQREEDEGEAGVDERSQRRAQVAEAGAAREQIHVQPVSRRIDRNRQGGGEDDAAHRHDRPERIGEAMVQRQCRPDGLERQERDAAEGGVGNPPFAPFACSPRRVAKRVVLERFVGNPSVVLAPDAKNLLWCVIHVSALCWCAHGGGGTCMREPCHLA